MDATFRPLRALALALVLLLCLPVPACRPKDGKPSSLPPALRDPMVVAVDGLAPANGLDGKGSLFLGDGWGRSEGSGDGSDWGSMAWVVGREASIHVLLPPGEKMDFFARCLPFPWDPGAPLQVMELLVGDRVAGRTELVRDWQDVRLPLPEGLSGNRMITLRLRFAHALKPQDLSGGGGDPRSLAAAFTQLALVPRTVADARPFLAAHAFDPKTGKAVLPAGGGLRLPLPPASHIRLQLSALSRCPVCRLSLVLTGPGEAIRPLAAEPQGERPQTVAASFDTAPRGLQSLWVRVTADQRTRPDETLELALGPVTVDARLADDGQAPPHIFIYLIDTLRADMLGPYGGQPTLTPRMNAFSREAVTYGQARAASTWTLPSVVSLLTGLYPDRHGATEGLLEYNPDRLRSLQQLLGERGYRTVGISHSFIISPIYAVDAGFDTFYYRDYLNSSALRSQEARGLLASWLSEQTDDTPCFAYLHTVDPHAPYSPPPGLREAAGPPRLPPQEEGLPEILMARGMAADPAAVAHLRALHEGEVRSTDREFGRFIDLLKWLGLYDQSWVILVGDHGEEFAEHEGFAHGTTLFEEVLRVPLIVRYPGGRWAGARIDRAVSLVDVAPTLLAGLAPASRPYPVFDGRALPGPAASGREPAHYFAVNPLRLKEAPVNLRGLTVEDLKCIENLAGVDRTGKPAPRLQAFDLAADPAERRPLGAGEVARCRQILEAWDRTRERSVKEQPPERPVTPEILERLRALGYLK